MVYGIINLFNFFEVDSIQGLIYILNRLTFYILLHPVTSIEINLSKNINNFFYII